VVPAEETGLPGGARCAARDSRSLDRETFGTAISFVRNRLEAERIAAQEQKLTFLLHVSGSFEDAGFTWNNAEALRVNALADPQVGQYLNRHFVSAFQKVATFQINGGQKQGGNVASYFCTPAGLVLHAVAGPVDAGTFLREARWANETYELAQLDAPTPAQLQDFFRKAHLDRLQREHHVRLPQHRLPRPDALTGELLDQSFIQHARLPLNNQGKVHVLLALSPTPPLGQVYQVVFERILNEKISTSPVKLAGK
jgi:hypothetical protein